MPVLKGVSGKVSSSQTMNEDTNFFIWVRRNELILKVKSFFMISGVGCIRELTESIICIYIYNEKERKRERETVTGEHFSYFWLGYFTT